MVLITESEVEKDQTNVDIKIKQWVEEWNGEQIWYVSWTDIRFSSMAKKDYAANHK